MSKRPRKLTAKVVALLDPADKARLLGQAAKAGMTPSIFVRHLIHSSKVIRRMDWQMRCQHLAKIGSNLNQVARWANVYGPRASADHILSAIHLLRADVNSFFMAEGRQDHDGDVV